MTGIDSGQTGIIVNLAGSERGVDDAKVETGWVVYNRFAKQLFEYPAFAQIVDYEPFDIQDKKGTIFKTDPTIEYFIEREDAKVVFLRYRKTTEELEQSVILTEVKNAYKDVAGLYETDSLINNRPAFEKEVEALLKERLSTRGFTFTNIQSSVKPNDVLQAAIVYRWKYVAIPEVAMTISMRPHWQLDSFGEVLIVCADNHK